MAAVRGSISIARASCKPDNRSLSPAPGHCKDNHFFWRQQCLAFLPPAMCGRVRSSASRPQSAKDRWRCSSFINFWPRVRRGQRRERNQAARKRGYWPHVLPSPWTSRLIDSCWLLAEENASIRLRDPQLSPRPRTTKSSFQKLMPTKHAALLKKRRSSVGGDNSLSPIPGTQSDREEVPSISSRTWR